MCIARSGGPEPLSSYHYQSEGGQKGKNVGRIGFVGALFEGVSLPVHWRLASRHSGPRPCTLSTTFYHFCPHPTPNWFIVNKKVEGVAIGSCPGNKSTMACG